jgi:hypothetical protein
MRVQYARTYDELRELFVKNGIDIWQTMDEIKGRLKELNIECDDRLTVLREDDDERRPVFWSKLVQAMRTEELDAKDRLATTPFLKAADDAETVDAHVLWPDTGLPWSMLPQPATMTRGEFNSYVANIKALRVEGHQGVQ